jgi:hypothetical protein
MPPLSLGKETILNEPFSKAWFTSIKPSLQFWSFAQQFFFFQNASFCPQKQKKAAVFIICKLSHNVNNKKQIINVAYPNLTQPNLT